MDATLFKLHAELEQKHWWFVARRTILCALLESVLPPSRNSLVVDVGCGTGANIAVLADRYSVVGIDTTADAIVLARERFPEIRFVHGVAPDDLGESFDTASAVLLMDVLEHVDDDVALLESLVARLKSGAHIVLTVPADMRLWSKHDESFGHLRRYDGTQLRKLWSTMPISEVMVSYFNTRLYPIARVARTLARLRARSWGRAGSDLSLPAMPLNRLLESILAGEAKRLVALAQGKTSVGYTRGVSLIALLRRE